MAQNVIETEGLTVFYGRQLGILDVDMAVRAGEVFGFLGPNGAGKTTTQRVLLDILRPSRGRARLFGLDCQREGVAIRRRLGYLPGELSLPGAMTGRRFLNMVAAVRGDRAGPAAIRELCARLDLDPSRKIRQYSRGNKQKLGLVAAFMGRPDLLILDEPTSGLDPLAQQAVHELVREARAGGRTVFFSSHILSEAQAICDRVGIIRAGRLIKVERVEALTAQPFHRLRLRFDAPPPAAALAVEGVQELSRDDHSLILEVRQNLPFVMQAAAGYGITDIETQPVTLEEVFLAYYGSDGGSHV
ncbi:MAG: ABC transporter ATP-binding protein [Candidatus Promineifilaceae bacterium]